MFFNKLSRSKKAAYAVPLTVFFIFFNVVLFLIIGAFGSDSMNDGAVGSGGGGYAEFEGSTNDDLSMTNGEGWLSGFKVQFFGLPGWVQLLLTVFEISIFSLAVYALIRGI